MSSTCETVSKAFRRNSGKDQAYEVGEKLVCPKLTKEGNYKCRVNFELTIVANDEDTLTLKDESLNETAIVKKTTADKYFVYSYCRTCYM